MSAAEFWSVFAVQCLAGRGMRSYLSSFLEGSGILEKLRRAIFFFFFFLIKRAKTLAHKLNSSLEPVQT